MAVCRADVDIAAIGPVHAVTVRVGIADPRRIQRTGRIAVCTYGPDRKAERAQNFPIMSPASMTDVERLPEYGLSIKLVKITEYSAKLR